MNSRLCIEPRHILTANYSPKGFFHHWKTKKFVTLLGYNLLKFDPASLENMHIFRGSICGSSESANALGLLGLLGGSGKPPLLGGVLLPRGTTDLLNRTRGVAQYFPTALPRLRGKAVCRVMLINVICLECKGPNGGLEHKEIAMVMKGSQARGFPSKAM